MKVVRRSRLKSFLILCLMFVMLTMCLTGCGSKETYTDVVKQMLAEETGTWSGVLTWSEGGTETSVEYRRVIKVGQDGHCFEVKVNIGEENSVVFNFVEVQGNLYLRLNDLRESLLSCKSDVFKEYADLVPNNIAYARAEETSWVFDSFYAEVGETDAGIYGLRNYVERCELVLNMFLGTLNSKGCLAYCESDGTYTLSSKDNLSSILLQMLRDSGSYYDKFTSNITSLELASEYEKEIGRANEKDNFLSSLADVQQKYELLGSNALSASISGSASVFDSKSGREVDGNLSVSWLNDTEGTQCKLDWTFAYSPTIGGYEWLQSTTIDVAEFEDTYFRFNNLIRDVLNEGDFLGGQYLTTSLEMTEESFREDIEELSKEYLGIEGSVTDFVLENKSDSSVLSLLDILDSMVGGFKVEVQAPVEEDVVEKYNKLTGVFYDGVEFVVGVNQVESTNSILAVDCRLLNSTESVFELKTKDFKLKDLGTSLVSANIESQLLEVNPDFNVEGYVEEISLESGCFVDLKLYFVLPEGCGYFDIYLKDECMGNLISF